MADTFTYTIKEQNGSPIVEVDYSFDGLETSTQCLANMPVGSLEELNAELSRYAASYRQGLEQEQASRVVADDVQEAEGKPQEVIVEAPAQEAENTEQEGSHMPSITSSEDNTPKGQAVGRVDHVVEDAEASAEPA